MTLDEAIKHCEDVADKLDARKKVYENLEDDRKLFAKEESDCRECANEHRQLAEWLRNGCAMVAQISKDRTDS